jgi:hypothetical protein
MLGNEPGAIHKIKSLPIESEEECSQSASKSNPYGKKSTPGQSKFVSIDTNRSYSKD